MKGHKTLCVNSPIGQCEPDHTGSPVGVVRMDPEKSYAGIGELLQYYINYSTQEAWEKIRAKIDYTFENLDLALSPLETETGFSNTIKARLEAGQKLLFKPNLVNPLNIEPRTHRPGLGSTSCTEWAFVAALMRWFREKLGISYHQMALGEASTMTSSVAGLFSMMQAGGQRVTPEAVIEGKSGDFYGGWGLYFARKYLADSMEPGARDDPMKGYDESVAGTYIPMGLVSDKLLVYDLNRIYDDESKGLEVKVPDGVNFKSITLHKAVVGGAREYPEDLKTNPGCILVNVPKLKVHAIALFTNVIKNLGIGLYPMQYAKEGGCKWDYSIPHKPVTGIKGGIPHQVWVPEMDPETGFPKRDKAGKYIVKKTGGITGTMIDIIKAVNNQDIFMIHIVDGIESINVDHQGLGLGVKVPEGIVFAGLDPVATDLVSARYMFSNVPLKEALEVDLEDGTGGHFPQAVPIPTLEGNNIISKMSFDCPLSRDVCFERAEKRGVGQRSYYVAGSEATSGAPLVSVQGHLGRISDGTFSDLVTKTLYFDIFKFPWDMQKTAFNYMEASDILGGTSFKEEFLKAFDEDGDGVVTYEEFGKKGVHGVFLHLGGDMISMLGSERLGYLKGRFNTFAKIVKGSDPIMNAEGHDAIKELSYGMACSAAFQVSQLEMEFPDFFQTGLICGKGKWPSFQLARFLHMGVALYGQGFPYKVQFPSLYASAMLYADLTQNGGEYAGNVWSQPETEAIERYIERVTKGEIKPLDFMFYVPVGYGSLFGRTIPNVKVTDDPAEILTASFAGGKEVWPEEGL